MARDSRFPIPVSRFPIFLTGIAALFMPTSAASQESRDTTRLRDVIVSAAGVPLDIRQAPATTTVLRGDDLRARGIASVADALRDVPGVAVVRSGSFGATTSLFVRGGERDYVKVLVDGVPMNDPGGDFDFAHLSVAEVDRIEVVRGPSSVLFGSDAVSAVVHIVTRRGRQGLRANGGVNGGTYGARQGDLSVDGGAYGFTVAASGSGRESDGILPFNNAYRASALGGTLGWTGRSTLARFTARRTSGRFEFPTDGAGVPVDSNQFTRETRDVMGLEGFTQVGRKAELRALLSYASMDRTSANLPDSPGDSTDFYFVSEVQSSRRGADLRASIALLPEARLTIGGALEEQREISNGRSTFGTAPLPPTVFDERRDSRAGYVELLATPSQSLQFAAGGRLDDNSRFGEFRTGRLSVVAWAAPRTAFRASFGTAFKEPAFAEVFPTSFTLGDSTLQPERTQSWEIGVEHTVGHRLTIAARYFDQRFRDLIQFRFVDRTVDQTTPNYANIAAATARGAEAEASLTIANYVRASAGATRVRTEVTDEGFGGSGTFVSGGPLLRRPEWLGNLSAAYRGPGPLSGGVSAHYTGRRTDYDFGAGDFVRMSPYTVVDVFANYRFPLTWSGFTLDATARIENAFDKKYQTVFGFDSPGRTVLVGARVSVD